MPWGIDPAVRRRFERRIYIPLPDETARLALLNIHFGATPHSLDAKALKAAAARTDGLSGADVSVMVRDALMEPVRELQRSEYFQQDGEGMWRPCGARARGARKMSLMEVPSAQLRTPLVTPAHLDKARHAYTLTPALPPALAPALALALAPALTLALPTAGGKGRAADGGRCRPGQVRAVQRRVRHRRRGLVRAAASALGRCERDSVLEVDRMEDQMRSQRCEWAGEWGARARALSVERAQVRESTYSSTSSCGGEF